MSRFNVSADSNWPVPVTEYVCRIALHGVSHSIVQRVAPSCIACRMTQLSGVGQNYFPEKDACFIYYS